MFKRSFILIKTSLLLCELIHGLIRVFIRSQAGVESYALFILILILIFIFILILITIVIKIIPNINLNFQSIGKANQGTIPINSNPVGDLLMTFNNLQMVLLTFTTCKMFGLFPRSAAKGK